MENLASITSSVCVSVRVFPILGVQLSLAAVTAAKAGAGDDDDDRHDDTLYLSNFTKSIPLRKAHNSRLNGASSVI